MLQKIKKSYFFSDKFFSLILVFFISFSIFSFGFVPRKVVKANPLVGVAEEEVVSIMVNILSSFGVVVSIPTAKDFLDEEKEFAKQKALELQNHKGAVTKGIQALQEGYYVSKEFVSDVLHEWEHYQISKNIDSRKVGNVITYTFPSFSQYRSFHTEKGYYDYYSSVLKSVNVTIPLGCYEFRVIKKDASGDSCSYLNTNNSKALFESLPQHLTFSVDVWNKQYGYKEFFINHVAMLAFNSSVKGLTFDFGNYVTKPQVDKKVIDNVLEPVNAQNQGMVISPEQVESVGKVLDSSIPDVPNSSISSTAPISSVGATSPSIVNGSDVGALPWEIGGESKPVDGTDNPPISKPVDGADSVDKPIGGIGENIWDKILEFLKKILVPSDNFFIDEFKALEGELNGKFDGNGLNYISDFKNNSKSVEPKFIYTFTIMGTTVTLDFSFITRIVPLCHIVFGGLTLLFLAWYHYKNVLLLIRGISPVEGGNFTGNSNTGIDFKAMGDSAPSSPVSTISTSKGNSNYSTTNKYSGGAK